MNHNRAATDPFRLFRFKLLAACLFAAGLQAGAASAADEGDLAGSFFLPQDKCGSGSAICEITLEIRGDAARVMYEKMKSKAVKDECTEGFVKTDAGALRCFLMPDKTYECDVGYSFAKKRIVGSSVTC